MTRTIRGALAAVITIVAFGAGGGVAAAAAPGASTCCSSQVTANSARLTGGVDPNGQLTSYYFEYGTTRAYGNRTDSGSVGKGTKLRRVSTVITGLTPNTVYHYRIVGSNAAGVASGRNRSFRTRKQPLALQFSATPNPVTFGAGTTLVGALTGTGNANRQIVLQQRPFPYDAPFANVGNIQLTGADGGFTFGPLAIPLTTQYRVVTTSTPQVRSPIVSLGVAVKVSTTPSTRRVKRGRLVKFSGSVRPARPGALYAIQKRTSKGAWVVVAGGAVRSGTSEYSRYARRVRVRRGGRYRVFVASEGSLTSGLGREILVHTKK